MGAEESKQRETYQGKNSQGVTKEEVQRLLDQQKRDYERKLKELEIRSAALSKNKKQNNQTAGQTTHSQKTTDEILGKQLQEFVHIAYPSTTSTSSVHSQNIQNSAKAPTPNERTGVTSRTSYSYTSDELRKITNKSPEKDNCNLYPNLETVSRDQTGSAGSNSNPQSSGSPVVANNQYAVPSTSKPVTPSDASPANRTNLSVGPQPSSSRDTPSHRSYVPPTLSNAYSQSRLAPAGKTNVQDVSSMPSTSKPMPSAPPMPEPKEKREERKQKFRPNNDSTKNMFNCCTCGKKFGLTIYQCTNGHSSCDNCKLRAEPCGTCRYPIQDKRNYAFEDYLAEMKEECPYHIHGCNLILKKADIVVHVKECPFRSFLCPIHVLFGRCAWRGQQIEIAEHFRSMHPEHIQGNVNTEMNLINLVDDNHTVHFVDMAPFNFLVHVKVNEKENMILVAVQHFGTQMSSSKWNYEIQIYNKRVPRQKFTYSDVCTSDNIPIGEIFNESKCAAIPLVYAFNFVNQGCLTYKFYIKRTDESAPSACHTPQRQWPNRGRGRLRSKRGARVN